MIRILAIYVMMTLISSCLIQKSEINTKVQNFYIKRAMQADTVVLFSSYNTPDKKCSNRFVVMWKREGKCYGKIYYSLDNCKFSRKNIITAECITMFDNALGYFNSNDSDITNGEFSLLDSTKCCTQYKDWYSIIYDFNNYPSEVNIYKQDLRDSIIDNRCLIELIHWLEGHVSH